MMEELVIFLFVARRLINRPSRKAWITERFKEAVLLFSNIVRDPVEIHITKILDRLS